MQLGWLPRRAAFLVMPIKMFGFYLCVKGTPRPDSTPKVILKYFSLHVMHIYYRPVHQRQI